MDCFLKKTLYSEVKWNILYYCSTQQFLAWNRWNLCGCGWKTRTLFTVLTFAHFLFQVEPWPGHIVFPTFGPQCGRPPTLVSWKPSKRNKTWRCADYNWEDSWEWVAAAENKLTFDTISLLAFDICSTITFHGKGEFEKNMSIPSNLRWLLLWTQLNKSRCMFQSLIKMQGRMKVLIAGSRAYSSLSPH